MALSSLPKSKGRRLCEVDGCDRDAAKGRFCYGHLKARVRQLRELRDRGEDVDPDELPRPEAQLREYGRSRWSWFAQWALRYADADSMDEGQFRRAEDSLRKAAQAYVDSVRAEAAKRHGRLGGLARANALSQDRRREIARKAAGARWRSE